MITRKTFLIFNFLILILFSCGGDEVVDVKIDLITKYHSHEFILNDKFNNESFDIYLDCKTNIREAARPDSKTFYRTVVREEINSHKNHNLYIINGNNFETKNVDSDIKDIKNNKSDIIEIVKTIVKNNNEAILITDGIYHDNATGIVSKTNNYIGGELEVWLNKGNEIYIYIENVNYKNSLSDKIFYIIFTNDKDEKNIIEKISDKINLNNIHPELIKISNSDLKNDGIIKINENLTGNISSISRKNANDTIAYFFELDDKWDDIIKYADPYLLEGLKIQTNYSNYNIEDLTVKAYNISDFFISDDSINYKAIKKEIIDGFEIDKETFNKSKKISLKLKEKIGDYLSADINNIIRIDIIISKTKELKNYEVLKLKNNNTCLYESIYQTVRNVNPQKVKDGILYTIYLKTEKN